MVVWGRADRGCRTAWTGQLSSLSAGKGKPTQASGPLAVRTQKHASSARDVCRAIKVSDDRFSYPHLFVGEVRSWRGTCARAAISWNARRMSCGDGPKECSGDGESYRGIREGSRGGGGEI